MTYNILIYAKIDTRTTKNGEMDGKGLGQDFKICVFQKYVAIKKMKSHRHMCTVPISTIFYCIRFIVKLK